MSNFLHTKRKHNMTIIPYLVRPKAETETSLTINATKSETSCKSIQKTGLESYSSYNYPIKWKPLFCKSQKWVSCWSLSVWQLWIEKWKAYTQNLLVLMVHFLYLVQLVLLKKTFIIKSTLNIIIWFFFIKPQMNDNKCEFIMHLCSWTVYRNNQCVSHYRAWSACLQNIPWMGFQHST